MKVKLFENADVFDSDVFDMMNDAIRDKLDISSNFVADMNKAIVVHSGRLFYAIDHSMDGLVRVKLEDLATMCGAKMKNIVNGEVVEETPGDSPIYLALVFIYVLFNNGIVCNLGELKDKQPVVIMRLKVDGDIQPILY